MENLITATAFAFYGIAISGIFLHAVKKWVKGEIKGSIVDWFIVNPRATAGVIITALGGVSVAILTGQIGNIQDGAHIIAVFGIGYSADSIGNNQKQL